LLKGHFVEGAGITEVKPEDFSKEIQEALATGILSLEELTGTALSGKNKTREMYYDSISTRLNTENNPDGVVEMSVDKNVCKQSDLIFVQDLKPIEGDIPASVSITDTIVEADVDDSMDEMMAELFGDLN
jgi:hypothetical protein